MVGPVHHLALVCLLTIGFTISEIVLDRSNSTLCDLNRKAAGKNARATKLQIGTSTGLVWSALYRYPYGVQSIEQMGVRFKTGGPQ